MSPKYYPARSVDHKQSRWLYKTKTWLKKRDRGMGDFRNKLRKGLLFLLSVMLFVLAIEVLKNSAQGIASLLENHLGADNPVNTLGVGWLFSYLLMSGSPVAAVGLACLDAGVFDRFEAFTMIIGSRLGAAFIVLFLGFIYIIRGHERRAGLFMGVLSLNVTASVYIPALALGYLLLNNHLLDTVQFDRGARLSSVLGQFVEPVIVPLRTILPDTGIFLVGLGMALFSFHLFDRALPEFNLEQRGFSDIAALVYRPVVMFILGCVLTLITLSVSLSLSLLVPLSARGYVRRENVIPYIMGANITTFGDTALAAILLGNADAFTVVLAIAVSGALVSLPILIFFYRDYERLMLAVVEWEISSNRHLVAFISTIFVVPIILMLI